MVSMRRRWAVKPDAPIFIEVKKSIKVPLQRA
jgi:hypothetical protein